MRRAVQALAVMLSALFAWQGVAQAQAAQSDTIRVLIRDMLTQSPLLRDTMTVVEDANYTLRVRDLLSLILSPDSTVKIRTSLDAVRFLERMLVPDTVLVRLESDPPGFTA